MAGHERRDGVPAGATSQAGTRRRSGRVVAACVATALVAAACTAPPGPGVGDVDAPADRVEVWSVLPPGNGGPGGLTDAHRDDQRPLYERLDDAVAAGSLDADGLGTYFKDARIDLPTGEELHRQAPRPGVTIRWDRWGVPHVEGATSLDVAFGAGFATMEGRGLVAEIARTVGRRGGQELGVNDVFAAIDPKRRIDYSDAELEARFASLVADHPAEAPAVLAEIDAYLAGINAWRAEHPELELQGALLGLGSGDWGRADVAAALLTVVTGNSAGGEELANAAALDALTAQLGPDGGTAAYRDLRAADAPSTPHVDTPSTYPRFDDGSSAADPPDPASVALPDSAIELARAADADDSDAPEPEHSNAIAVTAERSASGRPLLVGGPQNGLTSPALLFEMSLSGGGYRSRGVVAPGAGPYVFVGRGDHHAWTSTSGEADHIDTRAELLCEPDGSAPTTASQHQVVDGECVAFTRPAGATSRTVARSVHGPILATGTVDGAPVAFSTQRSSAGVEAHASIGLRRLNRNEVDGPADFLDAARTVTNSGHWFYVDDRDIAYTLVGRHPIRAGGVTTELPSWGTGEWEWRGWIDPAELPSAINPPSGCLHSWNNRTAPGWRTADDDWGNVGPHRVDLLVDRICGRDALTLSDLVAAHTEAGSTDLRGEGVLPTVLAVLDTAPAPSPQLGAVRDVLADWVAAGATRRDTDVDGRFDHPAVGVMDALFERVARSVFEPTLGGAMDAVPLRIDAGARVTGSSFGFGWYGLVTRDLERLLGGEAQGAELPISCGGGDLGACRDALWGALRGAAGEVRDAQLPWDRDDPSRWSTFTLTNNGLIPLLPIVFNPVLMRWSNRPAYQLAVEFSGS